MKTIYIYTVIKPIISMNCEIFMTARAGLEADEIKEFKL